MIADSLGKRLKSKAEIPALVTEAIADPSIIAALLEIIDTDTGSSKFNGTKIIRLVSELEPALVYAYFDAIARLIRHRSSFVKWDGITIIANLLGVDADDRFAGIRQEYLDLIKDPQMITAATVVGNAWKIVRYKPQVEPEVTRRLLAVPEIVYWYHGEPSPECNRVICGHVLDCLDQYYDQSGSQPAILEFARGQMACLRPAVAKRAGRFLKKHADGV